MLNRGPNNSVVIKTLAKGLQIYIKPNNHDSGPEISQYRDCIDIAVKLAFMFNKEKVVDFLNVIREMDQQKVKAHAIVKALSNDPTIDTNITREMKGLIIKIKQASDIGVVETFNEIGTLINLLLIKCKGIEKSDLEKSVKGQYKEILETEQSYDNTLKQLLNLLVTEKKNCHQAEIEWHQAAINSINTEHTLLDIKITELSGQIPETDVTS